MLPPVLTRGPTEAENGTPNRGKSKPVAGPYSRIHAHRQVTLIVGSVTQQTPYLSQADSRILDQRLPEPRKSASTSH